MDCTAKTTITYTFTMSEEEVARFNLAIAMLGDVARNLGCEHPMFKNIRETQDLLLAIVEAADRARD